METSPSVLSLLPQLSIGVVAIMALGYITLIFIKYIEKRDDVHASQLKEREDTLRALETEVRTSIVGQLQENSRVMDRVLDRLSNNQ